MLFKSIPMYIKATDIHKHFLIIFIFNRVKLAIMYSIAANMVISIDDKRSRTAGQHSLFIPQALMSFLCHTWMLSTFHPQTHRQAQNTTTPQTHRNSNVMAYVMKLASLLCAGSVINRQTKMA